MNPITAHRREARDLLRRYLQILGRQNDSIRMDDTDSLEFYLAEGRETLAALNAVQRVVSAWAGSSVEGERDAEFDELMELARKQHKANRELLLERRDELGRRISAINVPPQARSVFRPATHGGGMVDMSL